MGRHANIAAELLRLARRRAGLTQAELARRAGVPRSVLNAYEHGRRQPGVDALARILDAAGMSLRLSRPVHRPDPERAGRLLEQVLELAEALPHRPRRTLAYPPFTRRVA